MVVRRLTVGFQPDCGQQGGVIAEVVAAGGVVIGARLDLSHSDADADEAVVQALAAEARTDPTVVATRRVDLAVGVAQAEREQACVASKPV